MIHNKINGICVDQIPLVSCFLKGVFNSRPPAPKYLITWDVDMVLRSLPEIALPITVPHVNSNGNRCSIWLPCADL